MRIPIFVLGLLIGGGQAFLFNPLMLTLLRNRLGIIRSPLLNQRRFGQMRINQLSFFRNLINRRQTMVRNILNRRRGIRPPQVTVTADRLNPRFNNMVDRIQPQVVTIDNGPGPAVMSGIEQAAIIGILDSPMGNTGGSNVMIDPLRQPVPTLNAGIGSTQIVNTDPLQQAASNVVVTTQQQIGTVDPMIQAQIVSPQQPGGALNPVIPSQANLQPMVANNLVQNQQQINTMNPIMSQANIQPIVSTNMVSNPQQFGSVDPLQLSQGNLQQMIQSNTISNQQQLGMADPNLQQIAVDNQIGVVDPIVSAPGFLDPNIISSQQLNPASVDPQFQQQQIVTNVINGPSAGNTEQLIRMTNAIEPTQLGTGGASTGTFLTSNPSLDGIVQQQVIDANNVGGSLEQQITMNNFGGAVQQQLVDANNVGGVLQQQPIDVNIGEAMQQQPVDINMGSTIQQQVLDMNSMGGNLQQQASDMNVAGSMPMQPVDLNIGGAIQQQPLDLNIGGVTQQQPIDVNIGGAMQQQPLDINIGGVSQQQPIDVNIGGTMQQQPLDINIGGVTQQQPIEMNMGAAIQQQPFDIGVGGAIQQQPLDINLGGAITQQQIVDVNNVGTSMQPQLSNVNSIGETLQPQLVDVNNLGGVVQPQLVDVNNVGGAMQPQLVDVNNVGGAMQPQLVDVNSVGGAMQPQLVDVNNVGGAMQPQLVDVNNVGGVMQPQLVDVNNAGGVVQSQNVGINIVRGDMQQQLVNSIGGASEQQVNSIGETLQPQLSAGNIADAMQQQLLSNSILDQQHLKPSLLTNPLQQQISSGTIGEGIQQPLALNGIGSLGLQTNQEASSLIPPASALDSNQLQALSGGQLSLQAQGQGLLPSINPSQQWGSAQTGTDLSALQQLAASTNNWNQGGTMGESGQQTQSNSLATMLQSGLPNLNNLQNAYLKHQLLGGLQTGEQGEQQKQWGSTGTQSELSNANPSNGNFNQALLSQLMIANALSNPMPNSPSAETAQQKSGELATNQHSGEITAKQQAEAPAQEQPSPQQSQNEYLNLLVQQQLLDGLQSGSQNPWNPSGAGSQNQQDQWGISQQGDPNGYFSGQTFLNGAGGPNLQGLGFQSFEEQNAALTSAPVQMGGTNTASVIQSRPLNQPLPIQEKTPNVINSGLSNTGQQVIGGQSKTMNNIQQLLTNTFIQRQGGSSAGTGNGGLNSQQIIQGLIQTVPGRTISNTQLTLSTGQGQDIPQSAAISTQQLLAKRQSVNTPNTILNPQQQLPVTGQSINNPNTNLGTMLTGSSRNVMASVITSKNQSPQSKIVQAGPQTISEAVSKPKFAVISLDALSSKSKNPTTQIKLTSSPLSSNSVQYRQAILDSIKKSLKPEVIYNPVKISGLGDSAATTTQESNNTILGGTNDQVKLMEASPVQTALGSLAEPATNVNMRASLSQQRVSSKVVQQALGDGALTATGTDIPPVNGAVVASPSVTAVLPVSNGVVQNPSNAVVDHVVKSQDPLAAIPQTLSTADSLNLQGSNTPGGQRIEIIDLRGGLPMNSGVPMVQSNSPLGMNDYFNQMALLSAIFNHPKQTSVPQQAEKQTQTEKEQKKLWDTVLKSLKITSKGKTSRSEKMVETQKRLDAKTLEKSTVPAKVNDSKNSDKTVDVTNKLDNHKQIHVLNTKITEKIKEATKDLKSPETGGVQKNNETGSRIPVVIEPKTTKIPISIIQQSTPANIV